MLKGFRAHRRAPFLLRCSSMRPRDSTWRAFCHNHGIERRGPRICRAGGSTRMPAGRAGDAAERGLTRGYGSKARPRPCLYELLPQTLWRLLMNKISLLAVTAVFGSTTTSAIGAAASARTYMPAYCSDRSVVCLLPDGGQPVPVAAGQAPVVRQPPTSQPPARPGAAFTAQGAASAQAGQANGGGTVIVVVPPSTTGGATTIITPPLTSGGAGTPVGTAPGTPPGSVLPGTTIGTPPGTFGPGTAAGSPPEMIAPGGSAGTPTGTISPGTGTGTAAGTGATGTASGSVGGTGGVGPGAAVGGGASFGAVGGAAGAAGGGVGGGAR
jgi:hypothetical protein